MFTVEAKHSSPEGKPSVCRIVKSTIAIRQTFLNRSLTNITTTIVYSLWVTSMSTYQPQYRLSIIKSQKINVIKGFTSSVTGEIGRFHFKG